MFAYCGNNSVNMSDLSGEWLKCISGLLNVISDTIQMIANERHRVAVLSKYGTETIKVFLVP